MQVSKVDSNQNRPKRTPGQVVAGLAISTALCFDAPITSGIYHGCKNSKLERIPFKDAFVKQMEKSGKKYQDFFTSLKKFKSKNVGIVLGTLITAIDIMGTYLFIDWFDGALSKKIGRRKNNEN